MRLYAILTALSLALSPALPAQEEAEQKFAALEQKIKAAEAAHRKACRELYDFVQKGIEASAGTPAKEATNYLRGGGAKKALDDLKQGKMPGKWHLNVIRGNTLLGYNGKNWPKPPDITIPRAAGPIKIDGKLDDDAWKTAATFKDTYPFNQKEKTDESPTTYKIAWDDKNLYFAFDCVDVDLVAPAMERDDHVYFHDCVEMFILPEWRLRTYWELVIGPQGAVFDSLQAKNYNQWGCNSKKSENIQGLQVGIKLNGTLNRSDDKDNGYVVEIAVPFDQLPGYAKAAPAAGHTLHCMLVRLDKNATGETNDKGEPKMSHKAFAFTPLLSWGHNIWNHARLTLGK